MASRRSPIVWLVATAATALVAGAAAASACVPQPLLVVGPSASGAPGAQVTASGTNFPTGTVEVRWNGIEGPRLATASGPSFSVPLTVPTASDGLYVVVAVPRQPDGSVNGTVPATPFLVGKPAAAPARPVAAEPAGSAGGRRGSTMNPLAAAAAGAGFAVVGGAAGLLVGRRRRSAFDPPGAVQPAGSE